MTVRLELQERILLCTNCDLHTVGSGPVPFSGPTPAAFAILGEAPGREEDEKGRPFLGAAGKLLRSSLEAVGLDPERAFIFNTCCCFPDGTPTGAQVAMCRPNMLDQLALSGTGPVLVLGSTALGTFRSDLKISKAHGHVFTKRGRVLFVTFHPAAALYQRERLPMIQADLARFAQVVEAGDGWARHILNQCVACEKAEDDMEAEHLDDDGVLYCQDCWPRSPGGQAAKRAKRVGPPPKVAPTTAEAVAMVKAAFPGAEVVPA